MALFRALIGKTSTISKHYGHQLWKFALFLATAKFECWKRLVSAFDLQRQVRSQHWSRLCTVTFRCRTAAKIKSMHTSVDLLPDGHIVQHFWCCNLSKCCRSVHFFQWNESEHVVLPIIIIWHNVRWISGALNEHYLKFWGPNRALNAEKTRDAQSTKSKFYEY